MKYLNKIILAVFTLSVLCSYVISTDADADPQQQFEQDFGQNHDTNTEEHPDDSFEKEIRKELGMLNSDRKEVSKEELQTALLKILHDNKDEHHDEEDTESKTFFDKVVHLLLKDAPATINNDDLTKYLNNAAVEKTFNEIDQEYRAGDHNSVSDEEHHKEMEENAYVNHLPKEKGEEKEDL